MASMFLQQAKNDNVQQYIQLDQSYMRSHQKSLWDAMPMMTNDEKEAVKRLRYDYVPNPVQVEHNNEDVSEAPNGEANTPLTTIVQNAECSGY